MKSKFLECSEHFVLEQSVHNEGEMGVTCSTYGE